MKLQWLILAGAALMAQAPVPQAKEALPLRHAHGLGYSEDGSRILIPGHEAIMVHDGTSWSLLPGPERDLMGFVATRRFIFASGHFPPGGSRGAPLGLLRSADGGLSWSSLGFEGEAEFHVVAAGYWSDALYLHNTAPNSRMPRTGLYRMMDEGARWKHVGALGLRGEIFRMAVHPIDEAMVAAVTTEGLFLSRDGGAAFEPLVPGPAVRAGYLTLDGDELWCSTFDGAAGLFRMRLADGTREEITLPPIGRDAVAYIQQNPMRRDEFAVVTMDRAVFVTPDRGSTWRRIARARGAGPQRGGQ